MRSRRFLLIRVRPLLHRWMALVLIACLTALAASAQAQTTAMRVPVRKSQPHDCLLTVRARQALHGDPGLASLNLGVSVRSGLATIWGDVENATQSGRAQMLVGEVQGVLQVRNELRIVSLNDPMRQFLELRPRANQRPRPPSNPPAMTLGRPVGKLTSKLDHPDPAPSRVRIALLPPIPVPGHQALSAANATEQARRELTQSIERIRNREARYRSIRPMVNDGIVSLQGFVHRWEDAMELAQAIAKLNGVERVILLDLKTP